MRTRHRATAVLSLLAFTGATSPGWAAPTLRVQVDQRGDFLLVGNTLGHECNNGVAPVVGTVGACGITGLNDTAPDIHWRSESPGAGQAEANTTIAPGQSRSTAILSVPAGATVTHAYLYWGANNGSNNADTTVTLDRPGGFSQAINGTSLGLNGSSYHVVADVTNVIQAQGNGAYRVSGVSMADFRNSNDSGHYGGWYLIVLYNDTTAPLRNLAIYDGFDQVSNGNSQSATLSGFLVPNAGFTGKLGVVTFEGDSGINGDQFFFDGAQLSDATNPANNFFNGSRSNLGAPVSVVGDLPQLTGAAASMSGMDLDIVDVTAQLTAGQTSAPIQATSTGDVYYLAAFVTSVSTFLPDFSTSTKTVTDVNGGDVLPGDVLEYTITVVNTGNDTAIDVILDDPIPAGTTYVPGSLSIVSGANAGAKSDALGDDQAEFDGTSVVFRLGTGATAFAGGDMAINETTVLKFQVTLNNGATGTIVNQAEISAAGLLGGPLTNWASGGQAGPGSPTTTPIDECSTDAQCSAPTPACDTTGTPNECVECTSDVHCSGLTPSCDVGTNLCVCVANGAETCNGDDDDCDGSIDETFNIGQACTVGVGACQATGALVCMGLNAATCDAVPGNPAALETCNDAIDADCDGDPNNGCDDPDGDGILSNDEIAIGLDPNDADSDDDGVSDGDEPSVAVDTDGDGLINGLDADSDDDGLYDGTELGLDCMGAGTDASAGHCTPDGDQGATTTNPLDADTDDGGVIDGVEDEDLDGVIDAGETDPNDGSDDGSRPDTDGDGLTDDLEISIGTDPNDADSDDDGAPDGAEANFADDSDGDGLINALDPDSDDDGLFDGTELGLGCSSPGTDAAAGHCTADADDGATTTSMVDPDTDDGGVGDGSEDSNLDGAIDAGETDPNDPSDDDQQLDTDGDGLTDDLEQTIGTDPNDADSDDDGVPDGAEANFADDTDNDGDINALDPDSDGDGLFDGTELGLGCGNPDTDTSAGQCVADGDGGATTTSMVDPDTDDGGVPDGVEDADHDGVVDTGETDPNDPADDLTGEGGGGAGGAGAGGAGTGGAGTGGAGTGGAGGSDVESGVYPEGGGLFCTATSAGADGSLWPLAGLGAAALLRRRRRAAR